MAATAGKPEWLHWPPELFEEMQERIERFYDAGRRALREIAALPAADVRETPDRFVVEVDLPGVEPDQCEVTMTGRTLLVRAERTLPALGPNERALRAERRGGTISREIALPDDVREAAVTAHYQAGVLRIELPKQSVAVPQKINVRVD